MSKQHGQWREHDRPEFRGLGVVCSVCMSWCDNKYNYCPHCGAVMDLPSITEQARAALLAMGESVHKTEI
jgi:predicted amidophosphoribosyltransferase